MAKTAADQVAEMMIDAGIQRVYGVVGDSINPIVDVSIPEARMNQEKEKL